MMQAYINMTGTWMGHYYYGADYGEELHNEKVKFVLFAEQDNFKISGYCVDFEGVGTDMDKATIRGFLRDGFISFIKQYPVSLFFDEEGNMLRDASKPSPEIHYTGKYDPKTKLFSGEWEMVSSTESYPDHDIEFLNTGKWELWKED
jgi:hypothetical protein